VTLHFISTGIDREHFAQLLLCYLRCWGQSPRFVDNTDIWAQMHDQPDELVTSGSVAVILMTNEAAVLGWLAERPKVDFYWYQCLSPHETKISATIDRQDKVLALSGRFLYLLSSSLFSHSSLPGSIYFPAPSDEQSEIIKKVSSWGLHPRVGKNLIKKLDALFSRLHQIHGAAMKRSPVQFDLTPEPLDPIEQLLSVASCVGLDGAVSSSKSIDEIEPDETVDFQIETPSERIEPVAAIETVDEVKAMVTTTEAIDEVEAVEHDDRPHWSIALVDNQYLPILIHIDEYDCITEAEIIKMMGNVRVARRFTTKLEEYSKLLPFDVKVQSSANGNRYTKVRS
jgi:hypothetical protein